MFWTFVRSYRRWEKLRGAQQKIWPVMQIATDAHTHLCTARRSHSGLRRKFRGMCFLHSGAHVVSCSPELSFCLTVDVQILLPCSNTPAFTCLSFWRSLHVCIINADKQKVTKKKINFFYCLICLPGALLFSSLLKPVPLHLFLLCMTLFFVSWPCSNIETSIELKQMNQKISTFKLSSICLESFICFAQPNLIQ